MIFVLRNWQAVPVDTGQDSGLLTEEVDSEESAKWKLLASREAEEQAILHEYFEGMGGVEKLASMKSVRATGELTFPDGRILRAVVVKKAGGLIRFILGIAPRQIVIGVNPDDAWQSSWVDGREIVEDIDPAQLDYMRRSGHPVSKLFMAMHNEWSITYLGEKAFNYKMAHVFEVKIDARETARFFIDPETFLEMGTEEWINDPSGVTITRHLQSEHFEADGLTMPGRVETHINGVLSHTYIVQKVEVNPGVINSSFYRPEGD